MATEPTVPQPQQTGPPTPVKIAIVLGLLFVFLVGVKGMGDGFKLLGSDVLQSFFSATRNPFVGLAIGILATTLVQSSSVSTSMIVGLVASPENPLPVANAVPMVMGANIGTTVTNTDRVAGPHGTHRDEFRRAFSVATCHDFFNFMAVALLLPARAGHGLSCDAQRRRPSPLMLGGMGGADYESPIKGAISVGLKLRSKWSGRDGRRAAASWARAMRADPVERRC